MYNSYDQSAGLLLRIAILVYTPTWNAQGHLNFSILNFSILYIVPGMYILFDFASVIGEEWFFIIALICISLIIDEFEFLFIYVHQPFRISRSVNPLLIPFAHFSNWEFLSFLKDLHEFLIFQDVSSHLVSGIANIFSQYVVYLLTLSILPFMDWKNLILM